MLDAIISRKPSNRRRPERHGGEARRSSAAWSGRLELDSMLFVLPRNTGLCIRVFGILIARRPREWAASFAPPPASNANTLKT